MYFFDKEGRIEGNPEHEVYVIQVTNYEKPINVYPSGTQFEDRSGNPVR